MELKEFIVQTMKGITDGIAECEKQNIKIVKNHMNDVEFDVAVTIENSSKNGIGGNIQVAAINIGGNRGKEKNRTEVSRINFHIARDVN